MPYWKVSDGTLVALGGTITGASALAERLRADVKKITTLEDGRAGVVYFDWGPQPGATRELDLSEPNSVAEWVTVRAREFKLEIVDTDHPAVERDNWKATHHPGKVYGRPPSKD